MSRSAAKSVYSDFQQEFDAQTNHLLRRRFLWYSGTMAAISVFGFVLLLLSLLVFPQVAKAILTRSFDGEMGTKHPAWVLGAGMVGGLLTTLNYLVCFWRVKSRPLDKHKLLFMSYFLVVVDGVIGYSLSHLPDIGSGGLFSVLLSHVLACSFLPWTNKQAFWPAAIVWGWGFLLRFVVPGDSSFATNVAATVFSSLLFAPGLLIAWARHSRRLEEFQLQYFQRKYGQVRRELTDARKIHESLFPPAVTDGAVRMAYTYEPMGQIGGDYLFTARPKRTAAREHPPLNVVILDVTGHGISAALTVNRLYGELRRIFAERPDVTPGEVLQLLNRYANLTLATHSIYLTALCLKIESDGTGHGVVEYANGGHPPAFLRRASGNGPDAIEELDSTACVLGACDDDEFACEQRRVTFGPGDVLLAYTDGAIEARGLDGRMLGLTTLREMVLGNVERAAATAMLGEVMEEGLTGSRRTEIIARRVQDHRGGPPQDDTLVVEIWMEAVGGSGLPANAATHTVESRSTEQARQNVLV